jgi:glycosyltransferase involved in cell wall biosynthesis
LVIIGAGEEKANLEAMIKNFNLLEDIFLTGYIANPYPYMRKASAFVLPSKFEGLPGVLIEAMYCGIPIIATDCPSGPREILEDGRHGRLVPVGDVSSMSEAIIDGLNGKVKPAGRESWSRFSAETIVDQYIGLLLGNPGCTKESN